MKSIKSKKGKLIAVFGPDGSGKSAVYNLLKDKCKREKIQLEQNHWRPGFFAYKKNLIKDYAQNNFSAPHNNKSRSKIVSSVILFYIFFDFLFGYIFKIRPKLKKGVNVYYERYFYDIMVDQVRYHLKTPVLLRQILSKLVFRPDQTVILEAPSETIYNRKQELTIDEITKQQKRLVKIFKRTKHLVVIDVLANNAEESAEIVFNLIINKDA